MSRRRCLQAALVGLVMLALLPAGARAGVLVHCAPGGAGAVDVEALMAAPAGDRQDVLRRDLDRACGPGPGGDRPVTITEVRKGDYEAIKLVAGAGLLGRFDAAQGGAVAAVSLDSPGGNVDEAMKIGRLLRRYGMHVAVVRGARCDSACLFLLAGGVMRQVDAPIGLHRPRFSSREAFADPGMAMLQAEVMRARIAGYLAEMGVSPDLVDFMYAIAPHRIRYVQFADLGAFGLGAEQARVR